MIKPTYGQRQFIVYLLVGGWNTLFGMGVYALLYWGWGTEVNYMVLAVPANIIAITNAWLGYKMLVFKTRGNWIREYFRCYIVYGGGALLSMGLMWLLVQLGGFNPVIANVVGTAIVVFSSFFGHKYFSFRKPDHVSP